jgi:hypothetical protein
MKPDQIVLRSDEDPPPDGPQRREIKDPRLSLYEPLTVKQLSDSGVDDYSLIDDDCPSYENWQPSAELLAYWAREDEALKDVQRIPSAEEAGFEIKPVPRGVPSDLMERLIVLDPWPESEFGAVYDPTQASEEPIYPGPSPLDTMYLRAKAISEAMAQLAAQRYVSIAAGRQFSIDQAATRSKDGSRNFKGWDKNVVADREFRSELACTMQITESAAAKLIEIALTLTSSLPETMHALHSGTMSEKHAEVIADNAQNLPEELHYEFEKKLIEPASRMTVPKFSQRARRLREKLHPDSIEERTKRSIDGRNLQIDAGRDGMAWLSAYLPAVDAHAIFNRCSAAGKSLQSPNEPRTLTQLRVDVFSDLLIDADLCRDASHDEPRGSVAGADEANCEDCVAGDDESDGDSDEAVAEGRAESGYVRRRARARGIQATVLVSVPAMSLLGKAQEPASLEGYGPIDLDAARELAANAPSFIRLLTHPETGAVLSVGRDRYVVPADMRRFLRLRDETCRFPGCNRGAKFCDVDHSDEWQDGGHTDVQNLAHLCKSHHGLKTYTAWSLEHGNGDDGELLWTAPRGGVFVTEPANTIGFKATPPPQAEKEYDREADAIGDDPYWVPNGPVPF